MTEKDLDEMVMDYQRHSTEFNDDYDVLGWPRCAYTVSKVAVNAYTRILQKQLEEKSKLEIVYYIRTYFAIGIFGKMQKAII